MRFRIPRPSAAVIISFVALFAALGGSALAAGVFSKAQTRQIKHLISQGRAHNSKNLGGLPPHDYAKASQLGTSKGEKFLTAGQTMTLGKVGHFTFSSTCSKDGTGQNQVTFDVTADTTADLDGAGVVTAGTKVNIHTNSDALDTTPDSPIAPGDFDQVGSASSSTEIAADGQEVDIFYNDGVNWPAGSGSQAHDCFAGFTGLKG